MILYHGSNVEVATPRILVSDRKLDFGTGFYLTSSRSQAERWAQLTTARRKTGQPIITTYEFFEEDLAQLKTLVFEKPDVNWLKYTANNRRNSDASDDYDLVVGPVANDRTAPVIAFYYAGFYDEAETIRRLLPQKLRDQYAFKTDRALACITLREVIHL
mgnify:CR=1 FL=1